MLPAPNLNKASQDTTDNVINQLNELKTSTIRANNNHGSGLRHNQCQRHNK